MKPLLLLFLLGLFFINRSYSQEIRINEVMPSNKEFLQDEAGNFPDWIEIYNAGDAVINLQNYGLSDKGNDLHKWQFPRLVLSPGSFLLVIADNNSLDEPVQFWETLIKEGDEWSYLIPQANLTPSWTSTSYNDYLWKKGPSGFGYGDEDDATVLPAGTMSVFMRKEFNIENLPEISELYFHMDYDDAFVAYINGEEIARSNIGSAGIIPEFNEPALNFTEPFMVKGQNPEGYRIRDLSMLQAGTNILAVEVHNHSETSSDLTAIPFLSIKTTRVPENEPVSLPGVSSAALHASFKLDADGDSVFLSNPAGEAIDSIIFGKVPEGYSLGKSPDGTASRFVFVTPTPGRANSGTPYEGIINETPVFSEYSGFYTSPLSLILSSSDNSNTIYYTTDGSVPDTSSMIYSGNLSLKNSGVVRARIIRPGYTLGPVSTQTYIFERKPKIPVILLNTDPMNLWDYNTGIYVMGPNAEEEKPHFNANFWMNWEKPAHIELLEPGQDSSAFSANTGIRIYGGYSRAHPMKSLAVYARSKYGDKNISYPVFPEKDFDKYEAIVLRNSGNDWHGEDAGSGSLMRDMLTGSLIDELDIDHQAGRQSVVYINGKYWGIHNIREKINEHFIASNHNVDPDSIDLLQGHNWVVQGRNDHYEAMIDYMINHDIRNQDHYSYITSQMDIREFIDYCVVQIFIFNGDWPANNIKYWRTRNNGKWRWILYDTDFGFGIWDPEKVFHNTLEFATTTEGPEWPNPPWATFLLRRLLQNENFRNQFINSFADRLNTIFLPANINEKIDLLQGNIAGELPYHIERWNGYYPAYTNVVRQIRSFGNQRKTIMEQYLLSFFNLPAKHDLTISTNDPNAGVIRINSLKMNELPWTGTYFEDVPVQITAIPAPGYKFTEWTGSIHSQSPEIELPLTGRSYAIASFEKAENVNPYPVVINEISYKAAAEADSEDWIELYNNSDQPTDISGWLFRDSDDTHSYFIKENTVLQARAYLLISRDSTSFRSVYPQAGPLTGEFDFGLSSDGDQVRLYDSELHLMDSVNYGITAPWPGDVNGSGFTLSLIDPDSDNSLPENWTASIQLQGTPGKENNISDNVEHTFSMLSLENYPNPFSDILHVKVYNDRNRHIRLSLFDINGRLVKVIRDERMTAGKHGYTVQTSELPDGVYILKLEHEENTIYRKIMKIR